jgi:CRISPR system Cascade subunit CasA
LALVWLAPWDGVASLSLTRLDPFYIEICRRIRLQEVDDAIKSIGTGSKAARIAAKELNGMTGDAWTPIDVEGGKALTITDSGFNYKLVSDLLFGGKYQPPAAYQLSKSTREPALVLIAQGLTRGQGKTEGYHERRVPISAKVRGMLVGNQKDQLERLSKQRISAISEVSKLLWFSLIVLFASGKANDKSKGHKAKTKMFADPFERAEDARFFDDLNDELEATDPAAQHLQWLLALVARAEAVLKIAFDAGPRNGIQKYRAQSAALSRFHGGLRSAKPPLPALANFYREQKLQRQEDSLDQN